MIEIKIFLDTELQINRELIEKQSEKDISKRLDISFSKIDRKISKLSSHNVLRHSSLFESMNWDEQDSGKSGDSGNYFKRYSKFQRGMYLKMVNFIKTLIKNLNLLMNVIKELSIRLVII